MKLSIWILGAVFAAGLLSAQAATADDHRNRGRGDRYDRSSHRDYDRGHYDRGHYHRGHYHRGHYGRGRDHRSSWSIGFSYGGCRSYSTRPYYAYPRSYYYYPQTYYAPPTHYYQQTYYYCAPPVYRYSLSRVNFYYRW